MRWFDHRSDETFTFRRVAWPTWEEGADLKQVTGGSVELSALSQLKLSGSLDFVGDAPDDRDMVRCYYSFTDVDGVRGEFPLFTAFFSVGEPAFDGTAWGGTMELSSTLSVLADKSYGMPFTVAAGTQAVALAVELAEGLGLVVNNPDPSSYAVKSDHTFESTDSYLTIVNWLLSAAGYQSCYPDAYGTVSMVRYVEPLEREPTAAFADDAKSIMYPEVSRQLDLSSTPNAVRLTYETDGEIIYSVARNVDPEDRASVAFRGRERTHSEKVSELAGDTQAQRVANLKDMALKMLKDKSSEVEHVKVSHAWVPLSPNDAMRVDYASASLSWVGAVTNMAVRLEVSIPCDTTARRFVRGDFKYTLEGGAI